VPGVNSEKLSGFTTTSDLMKVVIFNPSRN